MFTGLIAELGTVERLAEGSTSCQLTVRAQKILPGVKIGDSIAVNGVCLTVVHLQGNRFTADVMPETVRRTTLRQLQPGDRVNLEKALRPTDGLDGHIVQGHVEGVGTIREIAPEGNALAYRIETPKELLRYIVEKGSVAIDGISLTVTETDDTGFSVSLIPHTAKMTTLGYKSVGDSVNLETDILARYVEKMLGLQKTADGLPDSRRTEIAGENSEDGLTEVFLRQHGF
ncbi:MAG: riboflavin synthase [Succiniclasticum sp.]|uniref:riboflavin synthase n=1 Tax=Succiniclasticum sp. TaxID=2775030 RepID=UPI002A91E09E|nr:riboflavin synthase [Succiniclasticum sp.]MBR1495048.1 riboflavin synthase [Acidaminococcaceae bacterium]MDY6291859.1 riboflavin synthase [Succiniclasticum sp.]